MSTKIGFEWIHHPFSTQALKNAGIIPYLKEMNEKGYEIMLMPQYGGEWLYKKREEVKPK